MAYKFQLGTARLSGSVIAEGALSGTSGVFDGGNITNVGTASIEYVSASVQLVGAAIALDDVSGIAGDALENNSGVLRVAAGGVTNAMLSGAIEGTKIANGAIGNTQLSGNISADKLQLAAGVMSSSAGVLTIAAGAVTNDMLSGNIGFSKLEPLSSANILVGNGSNVATSVAMTGDISITSLGATSIGTAKVTNTMLSGNIGFSKLEPLSSANILVGNGSNVATSVAMTGDISITSLGATSIGTAKVTNTMLSGNISADKLQLNLNQFSSSAGVLNLKPSISGSLTFENDITVNGNFTILGDTFSASVGTLLIQDALINIGDGQASYANGYGIEFGTSGSSWASLKTAQHLSQDALSSSLPIAAPALSTADWVIADAHISGNLPISASAFYGDGSNLTNVTAIGVKLNSAVLSNTGNIVSKLTILDPAGTGVTGTLPDLATVQAGEMYVIKDAKGFCSAKPVMIKANGSQVIDQVASVTLESDFAAITIFSYDDGGTKKWIIV